MATQFLLFNAQFGFSCQDKTFQSFILKSGIHISALILARLSPLQVYLLSMIMLLKFSKYIPMHVDFGLMSNYIKNVLSLLFFLPLNFVCKTCNIFVTLPCQLFECHKLPISAVCLFYLSRHKNYQLLKIGRKDNVSTHILCDVFQNFAFNF